MKTKYYFLVLALTILLYPASVFASHGWMLFFEGSFKGTFIDAKTEQPIEGVTIVVSYEIGTISFEPGVDTVSFKEDVSNKKGQFHILPHIFFYPSPFTSGGQESHFIAFKPGYKFYLSSKDDLDKNSIIKLEPVPLTYYRRYEELEKAKDSYLLDWQKTNLLKKVIIAEENQLRHLDRYPTGVIFKGFSDEKTYLINPDDISIDKNYIYVADSAGTHKIIRLNLNGDWVSSFGVGSGGAFAFSLQKEGVLWATRDNDLYRYGEGQKNDYKEARFEDGLVRPGGGRIEFSPSGRTLTSRRNIVRNRCRNWWTGENCIPLNHLNDLDTFHPHRFKIDKQNKIHFIAAFRPGLYVINKDGNIVAKYTGHTFTAIALDSEDNSYVTSGNGITKFNTIIERVKTVSVEKIEDRESYLNIAIDGNDFVYLSLKDSIHVFDSDLNLKSIIDLNNDNLGELGIKAIAVDKNGSHAYLIDSIYNRVMAYDLIGNKWVSKQIPVSQ